MHTLVSYQTCQKLIDDLKKIRFNIILVICLSLISCSKDDLTGYEFKNSNITVQLYYKSLMQDKIW